VGVGDAVACCTRGGLGLRTGARLIEGLAGGLAEALGGGLAEGLAEGLAGGLVAGLATGLGDGLADVSEVSLEQPTLPKAKRLDIISKVPVLVERFHITNNCV
jgi:hypothetical protein